MTIKHNYLVNNDLKTQFLESLYHITQREVTLKEKIFSLYILLNLIAEEATVDENLSFKTLFARLSYLTNEHKIDKLTVSLLHQFRIQNERHIISDDSAPKIFDLGTSVITNFINSIWEGSPIIPYDPILKDYFAPKRSKRKGFTHLIEALVVKIDYEQKILFFLDDESPDKEQRALFDIPHINEPFTSNILAIEKIYALPLHVNFVDTEITEEDNYIPKAFVVQPDYLMDVTSVANNTKTNHGDIWLYGLNKFLSKPSSKYILIGNIANYFLDALVADSDLSLEKMYGELFQLFPLEWATYHDTEIKEIIRDIKVHFTNLKRVIKDEFIAKDILIGQIYLEPSFYCRDYGIQGRLDLFHVNSEKNKADIIELKSGTPFMPNAYGINNSHYIQTLLYDMMITSSYKGQLSPQNYILYSKLDRLNLKYAPRIKNQQFEILRTRNELVAIDHALSQGPEMVARIMNNLVSEYYPGLRGFAKTDLKQFETIYQTSTTLDQDYFHHFASFIAKEMILSKTGEHGVTKSNGLASLWLENIEEKEDRFSIINHLQLIKNNSDKDDPELIFEKSQYTAKLSNFRKGDIAVLYPHHHNERNILRHQIFKCSITAITDTQVIVRMRSPQYNQQIFVDTDFWNIEQDVLSSSFNHMFRGLFSFLSANPEKKSVLLGLERPKTYDQTIDIELDEGMTSEQKSIVYKAFNTKDYFLIWGPPGTGKTSIVLKNLVVSLYKYTSENILLLAYTNRAVDEICEALERSNLSQNYIRIGSRYSVGEEYQDNLLGKKIKGLDKRASIVDKLTKTRIYVSTVASIIGKKDLFKIVKIDTVIIDEASQILEPMLIGLLPQFSRFIMIGDHKQLPAVVVQNPKLTKIKSDELNEIGVSEMRMSLFERLYSQCKRNDWTNAWAILTHQGRMHQQIMRPVNELFYEGKLKSISTIKRLSNPISSLYKKEDSALTSERLLFVDTPVDTDFNWKTNVFEAEAVIKIVQQLSDLFIKNNLMHDKPSIGVITPYRAQIALIKSKLQDENISVDTVERYQGGARDIIILSLTTNRLSQLASLVSLSTEGIDRKLNVALTRAKEQIIIIGNSEILEHNTTYKEVIQYCHQLKLP